jgi:single-strand DNA-binding protein
MGNVTRDPQLRSTSTGKSVVTFSLALNHSYKDAKGEWKETASFVDVSAWAQLAEKVNSTVSRGTQVLVQGRIQSQSWEQNGQKRTKVEVLADKINVIGAQESKPQSQDVVLTADDIDENEPIDLSQIPF